MQRLILVLALLAACLFMGGQHASGSTATAAAYSATRPQQQQRQYSRLRRERRYASKVFGYPRAGRQMRCLDSLWDRESGWNPWAVNPNSGAYGIPQALGHGHPFPLGRYRPQIRWGHRYIRAVYQTACAAWSHELATGWY